MAAIETLTLEGLKLALQTVQEKWRKQGAVFLNDVQYGPADITGLFVFDDVVYEVTVRSDTSLFVVELEGEERRPVRLPPGLKFPKGFLRTDGYDR